MYIESWVIVLVVILLFYLLYRIYTLHVNVTTLANWADRGIGKKKEQIIDLCAIIVAANRTGISKLPKKLQQEIYLAEAKQIFRTFKHHYNEPTTVNGKTITFEDNPYVQINTLFLSDIQEDDRKPIVEIARALEEDAHK